MVTHRAVLPLPWGEGDAERRVRGTRGEKWKRLLSLYYEILDSIKDR